MASYYGEMIERCRQNFGLPPRNLDREEKLSFELNMEWIRKIFFWIYGDKIMSIIRDQNLLRDNGRVIWGNFVQANYLLYQQENKICCPANLIYSVDPFFDDNPEQLKIIAKGISITKGKPQQDQIMDRVSNAVTDEMKREMRMKLPESMCGEHHVYFTSTLIQPAHLPGNRIANSLVPVVIYPEKTESIMVLPSRFWDQTLQELWQG